MRYELFDVVGLVLLCLYIAVLGFMEGELVALLLIGLTLIIIGSFVLNVLREVNEKIENILDKEEDK